MPEGDGYREPVRNVENYGGRGAGTDSRDLSHFPHISECISGNFRERQGP